MVGGRDEAWCCSRRCSAGSTSRRCSRRCGRLARCRRSSSAPAAGRATITSTSTRCSPTAASVADYRTMIADAGLTISALSCHGNPLHPDPATAREHDDDVPQDGPPRRAARGAGRRHVLRLSRRFRGRASIPNWVTTPWPPEFLDVLDWQWEKKAIPYWTEPRRIRRAITA